MSNNQFESKREYHSKRPSLFGPLLLIGLGVILLLNTLNIVEGASWQTLLRLWPLLLIAAGLDGLWRGEGFVGSIVVMGLGAIFLLANLNVLGVSPWAFIIRFWPLIIIGYGLDLIIGQRGSLSAMISVLIGLAIVGGMVALAFVGPLSLSSPQTLQNYAFSQTIDNANSAKLSIKSVGGNLFLTSGAEGQTLVEGDLALNPRETVSPHYIVQSDRGIFNLETSGYNFVYINRFDVSNWNLRVNNQIPLEVQTRHTIGNQTIDLRPLQVEEVDLKNVLGNALIYLPERSTLEGNLSSVIGDLAVVVPDGVDTRLKIDTGITSVSFPDGFIREGDYIYSSENARNNPTIDIDLEQTLGSVRISLAD
jgi:hypothetical protein